MEFAWGEIFGAALSAAVLVKILDILYQEFQRRRTSKQTAREFVDANLDPLLKAADELTGKLRALAENDFKPIHNIAVDESALDNRDFASLMYLSGDSGHGWSSSDRKVCPSPWPEIPAALSYSSFSTVSNPAGFA